MDSTKSADSQLSQSPSNGDLWIFFGNGDGLRLCGPLVGPWRRRRELLRERFTLCWSLPNNQSISDIKVA